MADDDAKSPIDAAFLSDVIDGLSETPKTLPCQWLYDARGSDLFEQITQLPEYYVTRTEQAILNAYASDMARMIGPRAHMVEYGAGASIKTRTLLNALDIPSAYWPVDVSEEFLLQSAAKIGDLYPDLTVNPVVGTFFGGGPDLSGGSGSNRLGFFPGSTIGNLSDDEIIDFLSAARKKLGDGAKFLLGADLKKPVEILVPAYDDAAGITAAFNLNLLRRINRELGADFDLEGFHHEARWNDADSRIEMHLVSRSAQTVVVGGERFDFAPGETIHTENSRKFEYDVLKSLCRTAGWQPVADWTDDKAYFAMGLFEAI